MRIIEITAQSNGAHRNQTGGLSVVPDGWAVFPADLETENFPFGDAEVSEVDGVMTVTKWTPLPMPEPEPIPEPEEKISVWDELDAAYQEGVDSL